MANAFQTVDWMSMKCLSLLKNKLAVVSNFSTDAQGDFEKPFAVNDSIRMKKPQRFLIRNGLGYTPDPLNRIFTTINLNQPFGIDFEWDSYEKAVKMERSNEQLETEYLAPAMAQIAQEIDSRAALWAYQNSNNFVGVLGTDPTSDVFDGTSAAARQRLVELGGANDEGNRVCIVPPNIMRAAKKSSIAYFNPVSDISKQFRTGIVGSGDGFEWYESMSLYSHTSGVWAGAVTVTTAPVNGATTLAVTCTNGDTFLQGDAFDIASVYQVNPMTRRKTTSVLKPFAVTVPTTGASSAATLTLNIPIYGPGSQYQNVDALPVAGAALTMFRGTAAPTSAHSGINGLAFTKHAFAFVGVPLEKPSGSVEICWQRRDPESGVAIRFIRQFDGQLSRMINRFDCLIGFGNLYNDECCVRILGA